MRTSTLTVSIVIYKPDLTKLTQTLNSLRSTISLQTILFDNSPQPLPADFLASHPQIKYHYNQGQNWGFGRAHNEVFRRYGQEAPYFLILNPDIYFSEDLLTDLLEQMKKDPEIGAGIPQIRYPDGSIQYVNRRVPTPLNYLRSFIGHKMALNKTKPSTNQDLYLLKDMDLSRPILCPILSGCFLLYRSDVFLGLGGFDERYFLYAEDTDLSRRTCEKYKTVVFSNQIAYHHYNRGAYKSIRLLLIFVKNLFLYFNKWGWFFDPARQKLNNNVRYYLPPE